MIIRSILFYAFLGVWTIFMGTICLPYLFTSYPYMRKPINVWILGIFQLLETICNITYEIRGRGNVPEYAVIVASKHQSAFETLALFLCLKKSVFIHKKQLFYIPIFGQYLKKSNMISIDRSDGPSAIRKMLKQAKSKISEGYSIIVFPEGTRKKPGEKPDYKTGFIGIYNETNSEILPVAVNSGHCWPKHTFVKKPGHIIIKILKPIASGLKRPDILNKVQSIIEEETNKII